MRPLFFTVFFLAFFFSGQLIGQSVFLRVGVTHYQETPRLAKVIGEQSPLYGKFGNGYGLHTTLHFFTPNPSRFFLRTGVLFFPKHLFTESSGPKEFSQVLVPLEASASVKLVKVKRFFLGITAQAGPQFVSTLSTVPGSHIVDKSKSVMFGYGVGLYDGLYFGKNKTVATSGVKFYRIGKNNFVLYELAFPVDLFFK
jgi:hypothetical protein